VVHLRVIAPPDRAGRVHRLLLEKASVCHVARFERAANDPEGDVIDCDVAREDASLVVEQLRGLGIEADGAIVLQPIEAALSRSAERAEAAAVGSPADAIVWEQVEEQTSESSQLSLSYLAFLTLATLIAGVGILTDSLITIIGAMVVGPEFGAVAGFAVAIAERRAPLALRSLAALALGFPLAIGVTAAATLLARAADLGPEALTAATHPATIFISDPDVFSVIVALLAGAAGVLSLTTAKSGALIGVLISVVTIPAAGNIGVALAYGDWNELGGALAQLSLNITALLVAATGTLVAQRALYAMRRRRLAAVRELR
jgi:uncharacterized hydrophobic protein (TIGR00271 family)